jgi:predicted RecB family nuclease
MLITSFLFEAYLKCQTKCFLRSLGETTTENSYSDWIRAQQASYRSDGIKRLTQAAAQNECVTRPIDREDVRAAKWRFAVETTARAQNLESTIHAVERLKPEGQDNLDLFTPIRFIFTNKLHKDAKLLLAFDAFVLSELLGREVGLGKIIHGDDRTTLNVKTGALVSEVRRLTGKIDDLLSSKSPPELILNPHCPQCEFQNQCRPKAIEKDDISLLSGITETERKGHRSKGIFTVTQLSYTFRPRRVPKRAKNPATPHYYALQALAIRENTVYIHGTPRFPESKTQIYLDIEGLPDNESYYLIGALVVSEGKENFHSFWADHESQEPEIFSLFVDAVCQWADFRILHFGRYETGALKRMRTRMPESLHAKIDAILERSSSWALSNPRKRPMSLRLVLVSDFFTAYDSLASEQQKCLVHLLRDIDDDLLRNPLDSEFKNMAQTFATLLRTIIETVDRFGLKSHHLHKHKRAATRFLDSVASADFSSQLALKYKKRFQKKSGEKLFTFLDYDGVPWNNTNAEHAIKRFAKYRRQADGCFTERSLQEYLVLASVFETCEFNNVNILKFLLSKETTLEGLIKLARRRTKTSSEVRMSDDSELNHAGGEAQYKAHDRGIA